MDISVRSIYLCIYIYLGTGPGGHSGNQFRQRGGVPAPGAWDGTQDMGRDTGRDMGRDMGRDTGRDMGWDAGRGTRRDTRRDMGRDTRKSSLHWGWLSSGITCMAMFAAFPSTIMDSTTVGGRRRRPPTVVEAAEGRLHNGGWEGGKHSHTSNPR